MKKYFKNLSWTQRSIMILAVILLGTYYYFLTGSLPFQKETVTVNVEKTKDGETVVMLEDTNMAKVEKDFAPDMPEEEVMAAIHQMSHQKVKAAKKWGALPLTPNRVKRLIEVVSDNRAKYVHASVYLDILTRWSKGDFSQVDHDHNAVWKLQGGTVGAAKGIASVKEEQQFIDEHFKVKQ
ncbi:DUF6241 domain-containing protein [Neobacillus sp. 19]|uniref:DUF6241 domain-containing protein n=1 Tax=Neobacillus sp. 19 TaxID=3394458 RepID=UPI003BF7314A